MKVFIVYLVYYFSAQTLCSGNKSCVRIKAQIFSASEVAELFDYQYKGMYQYIFLHARRYSKEKARISFLWVWSGLFRHVQVWKKILNGPSGPSGGYNRDENSLESKIRVIQNKKKGFKCFIYFRNI